MTQDWAFLETREIISASLIDKVLNPRLYHRVQHTCLWVVVRLAVLAYVIFLPLPLNLMGFHVVRLRLSTTGLGPCWPLNHLVSNVRHPSPRFFQSCCIFCWRPGAFMLVLQWMNFVSTFSYSLLVNRIAMTVSVFSSLRSR